MGRLPRIPRAYKPRSHEDFNSLPVASRFESTSRGGLNPGSFKFYATGSELKSSCERGYRLYEIACSDGKILIDNEFFEH